MSERKVFAGSVIKLPEVAGRTADGLMVNAVGTPHTDQTLEIHFSFAQPQDKQKELEDQVARGQQPEKAQIAAAFTAKTSDAQPLISWMKDNGYEIVGITSDGVYARASASQIARTLAVNMVPVTKEGITFMAAQNEPSLPAEIGAGVQAINGLQPFRHAHKHLRKLPHRYVNRPAEGAVASPAASVVNGSAYMVSDLLKAYNADNLGVTGQGQTIAILIDTFPADSDLTAFWAQNNIPATLAQIQKINVAGGTLPDPSEEETLDASWSSGIAPGAQIRIYAAGGLTFVELDRALDAIVQDLPNHPEMRQLSISLGLGEDFMTPDEVDTQHAKLLHLAASGVNVFVSSGDAGSNPDQQGGSTGPTQVEYGASDPVVVGVGGTTLLLTSASDFVSETGWSGSGGGASQRFDRPVWQTGEGVPPSATKRLVPDVSLVADPNTGAFLVFQGQVGQPIGGTSWSAPVWAGFCALINEARANAGKPPLPFLNTLLYPLVGTAAFRDIAQGSNGSFTCGVGYDQVTGLGTPNIGDLIQRLV